MSKVDSQPSRLEQLINELCPNGVEWKTLEKVAKISNGKDHKHLEDGIFPVYGSGGIMRYASHYIYDKVSVLIPRKGSIGNIFYVDTPFWTVDTIFYTKINFELINARFLYHFLHTQNIEKLNTAGGVPSLTKAVLDKIQIPIPPLPVQEEIVRILDNFTELTARKKQYEYYRDALLTFGDYVEWKTLNNFCDIGDGLHGTPKYDDSGEYYFVNGNNLSDGKIAFDSKTKKVNVDEYNRLKINFAVDTILMSINGTIGNIAIYNGEKVVLGKSAAYFSIFSELLNLKFLYYYLQTTSTKNYFANNLTGSTIKNLGLKTLRDFKIPIPSLAEQQRIVDILDRFDTLCNDISQGLPAEIKARQQQYEYYRDKLLAFQKLR